MGRKFKFVSIERILSKIYRDLGIEEISETDLIEWTGEALNFMETPSLLEEAVAFIEVSNHAATIPDGLQSVIQVARNNNFEKEEKVCPTDVFARIAGEGIDCTGFLNSTSCNADYYIPYFEVKWATLNWARTAYYTESFSPMRLANHSFFGNLVCEEEEQIYDANCTDEYTIAGDVIKTSFKTGQIAVAYYKQITDPETGYPMVPDDSSFTTAITVYITMKYMARLWYMGREGYGDKMQKAEADWQWYCKQASNKAFTLHGEDEHQNFLESRYQMVPRLDRYYGYFGKMSRTDGVSKLNAN